MVGSACGLCKGSVSGVGRDTLATWVMGFGAVTSGAFRWRNAASGAVLVVVVYGVYGNDGAGRSGVCGVAASCKTDHT